MAFTPLNKDMGAYPTDGTFGKSALTDCKRQKIKSKLQMELAISKQKRLGYFSRFCFKN